MEEQLEQRFNVVTRRYRGDSRSRLSLPHGRLGSNLHIDVADQRSSNRNSASTESTRTWMERRVWVC
jgi:hypothetical protein